MIKTSIRILGFLSICLLLVTAPRQYARAQEVIASYQTFYDQLAPYGQWVTDPQYGDVWVPNAEPGFRPYATNGHWAMTDYGNTWVSDDPYGWAVYHYGRWTYNPYYGWVWIPGSEWAPAWVSWRSGEGFYGWAPMGPGYEAGGSYAYPDNYWIFVGPENLYRSNVYSYYDNSRNYYFIQHTGYMHEMYEGNGMRYNYGPRPEMIERETHQPVQVYRISNAREVGGSRISGNSVSIYRPAINPASERTSRPANAIRATQPIGRPQEISRGGEKEQPAFRQEIQRQTPQTRFQNNNANPGEHEQNMNNQPANNGTRQQHFQQNNPSTRSQQYNSREPQYNNQPARQQPEPSQQQNHQQGGNNQQQMNRPQQGQQQRPQQTSRPQPQKETNRK